MAIAFDKFGEQELTATLEITPVGTPRGVILFTLDSTNELSSATYGGVSMTKINSAIDSSGEPGIVSGFFLGNGIPTGTQTVSLGVTQRVIFCILVTASGDTELAGIGSAKVENDIADPSLTITGISGASFGAIALWSGLNSPTMTGGAGMTNLNSKDIGNQSVYAGYKTSASGDLTMSVTATSDDVAMLGIAIQEKTALRKNLALLGVG